jgi:hypothetical protein
MAANPATTEMITLAFRILVLPPGTLVDANAPPEPDRVLYQTEFFSPGPDRVNALFWISKAFERWLMWLR